MKFQFCIVVLFGLVMSAVSEDDQHQSSQTTNNYKHTKSQVQRPSCMQSLDKTATRRNTSGLLRILRYRMKTAGLHGLIISAEDIHKSEMVPPHLRRLKFVTAFSGSRGTAIVMEDHAALWVEGRFLSQAEEEVDCNWQLINGDSPDVLTTVEWVKSIVGKQKATIGVDARVISFIEYQKLEQKFSSKGIELLASSRSLVDEVWTEMGHRPKAQFGLLSVHSIEFAGESWQDKVRRVREFLKKSGIDSMFVTSLQEIAWLYNLRGSDIPYSPLFEAFAYVHVEEQRLYVNGNKLSTQVRDYLIMEECTNWACVQWRDYNQVYSDIIGLSKKDNRILVSSKCSYAICSVIDQNKLIVSDAPIKSLMTIKNNIEIRGMKNANIKDSVAIVTLLSEMEHEILKEGIAWNERHVIERLNTIRKQQDLFRQESFPTISAAGVHTSIPHYQAKRPPPTNSKGKRPTTSPSTTRRSFNGSVQSTQSTSDPSHNDTQDFLTSDTLYLIDTGAHYLDGTTDITRTIHLGKPSETHKDIYTRLLMGHIDLFLTTFPEGTKDYLLDSIARRYLWQVGKDYLHGTGHGVGNYLYVKEIPPEISPISRGNPLFPGNILTNEPAYYEADKFGIKIENTMLIVPTNNSETITFEHRYCRFEVLSYVPFEPKLIKTELMSLTQLRWLNEYHAKTFDVLSNHLKDHKDVLHWVEKKTAPLRNAKCSAKKKYFPTSLQKSAQSKGNLNSGCCYYILVFVFVVQAVCSMM